MTDAFADYDVAGVQVIVNRDGNNIVGKYFVIEYLGKNPYTIVDVTYDNGIEVILKNNFNCNDATMYVAVYEGNEFKGVDVVPAYEGTIPADVEFNPQTQTLKVFVWDDNLTPLADAVEISFAEVGQNF